MVICPECGQETEESFRFCLNCGADVEPLAGQEQQPAPGGRAPQPPPTVLPPSGAIPPPRQTAAAQQPPPRPTTQPPVTPPPSAVQQPPAAPGVVQPPPPPPPFQPGRPAAGPQRAPGAPPAGPPSGTQAQMPPAPGAPGARAPAPPPPAAQYPPQATRQMPGVPPGYRAPPPGGPVYRPPYQPTMQLPQQYPPQAAPYGQPQYPGQPPYAPGYPPAAAVRRGSALLGFLGLVAGAGVAAGTFLSWTTKATVTGWQIARLSRLMTNGNFFFSWGNRTIFFSGFWSLLAGALIILGSIVMFFRRSIGGWITLISGLIGTAVAAVNVTMMFTKMSGGEVGSVTPGIGLWLFVGLSAAALVLGIIGIAKTG